MSVLVHVVAFPFLNAEAACPIVLFSPAIPKVEQQYGTVNIQGQLLTLLPAPLKSCCADTPVTPVILNELARCACAVLEAKSKAAIQVFMMFCRTFERVVVAFR